MTIQILTADTFDEAVLTADRPLLVEFTAEWCPPCQHMKPVLSHLAGEMEGRIDIAVIDFDTCLAIGSRYEVMALPTMILFVSGEPVRRLFGARGTAQLRDEMSKYLAPAPT